MSIKGPSLVAWGVAVSLAVHVGAAVGIKRLPPKSLKTSTFVSVVEQKKPEKKKPLPKKEEPKEEPKKDEPKLPKAPPKIAPPPPPVAPPPEAPPPAPAPNPNAFAGNPGLAGLKTIGPINGGDGLAIPTGDGAQGGGPSAAPSETTKQKEKVLGPPKTNAGGNDGNNGAGPGECAETVTKPKPTSMPQPSYSDEARSAEVEGVVQVRVRVDASGHVLDATLVKGLGHGLDERALAAAKQWVFSPGTKCGSPAESSFVMNMRFALGE